jgi:hypothetical protein
MPWHFNNLTTLTGSVQRATFNLSAFINPNDPGIHGPTRHVFFQGHDRHIHEFWWDGNWHHDDLTDNTDDAPRATGFPSSYMFKGTGTKHVIYQGFDFGDNGRINELWWDGDWHHNDLTSAAGNAPLTIGLPFGYEYSFFDTIHRRNIISQRVVYRTLDFKLHLLHWSANDGWHHMPLPLPDVPVSESRPTAYVFSVQGQAIQGQASQRVLYLSPSMVPDIQHVHEFTWNEKGPNLRNWVLNDLTALTGAPPLGFGLPVGLMHDLEFTLHVFYGRGEGADLYELYWNDSGWHFNDLTAIMGRTIAGNGPPLAYVHLQQGTLNVNFIGTDGHIHALWREVGMPWNSVNQENLTLPIGAPPAASQPVGFVFRDLTQHMFYIAQTSSISQGGDIIELTDEPVP